MDRYNRLRQILQDLHWNDPYLNKVAYKDAQEVYPLLDNCPILKEIFDVVIFPTLAERLVFGERTTGDLFSEE